MSSSKLEREESKTEEDPQKEPKKQKMSDLKDIEVIDWDEAMQQCGDDEEFLRELLGDLRDETDSQMSRMDDIIKVRSILNGCLYWIVLFQVIGQQMAIVLLSFPLCDYFYLWSMRCTIFSLSFIAWTNTDRPNRTQPTIHSLALFVRPMSSREQRRI